MIEHWPWWMGAIALTATSLGFVLALGRPLGVSSSVATLLDADERRADFAGKSAVDEELERATREMFGDAAIAAAAGEAATKNDVGAKKLSWWTSLAFLLGIVGGGFAAAASRGALGQGVGATYASFFGDGALAYVVVFLGSVAVGFGTQLGGGCTSGHGLVGVARMQPGSLLSTAVFFGTAIATSFLLAAVLR